MLRRVVGMLAARADLPLDRLDDAVLVADLIAARAPAHASTTRSTSRSTRATARCSLRVGPLRAGGGQALIVDAAVPGVGNVIEQLADELTVTSGGRASSCTCGSRTRTGEDSNRLRPGMTRRMAIDFAIKDRSRRRHPRRRRHRRDRPLHRARVQAARVGADRRRPLDVIVDLSETTFIDSSSLGVLIGAHRRLKLRGGSLVVVCDNEAIVKTFRITGLDGVFTLCGRWTSARRRRRRAPADEPPARVSTGFPAPTPSPTSRARAGRGCSPTSAAGCGASPTTSR